MGEKIPKAEGRYRLADRIRPALYCDIERKEMDIGRQRHLCEAILGYNISNPFPPSRSRITNCGLILGTGNNEECRSAIRQHLMSVELPFTHEATAAGCDTPRSLSTMMMEPLPSVGLASPYIIEIVSFVMSKNISYTKNAFNDTTIAVEAFQDISKHTCDRPLEDEADVESFSCLTGTLTGPSFQFLVIQRHSLSNCCTRSELSRPHN